MAKKDITRKQLLKEPDRFITTSGKLIAYARAHRLPLLIAAGAVLVLLLAVVTVRQVSNRNERLASERVDKAVAQYAAALKDTDPKTARDRVKTAFEELFSQYGSKSAVKIARIVYGDICYRAGDGKAAIDMYTKALDDYRDVPALKNIILNGLAYAYVLDADDAQSIRYFKMITEDQEKTLQGGALFNLAWLYAASGDKTKSTACYEQLLKDFPDDFYSSLAKEKVNG